MKRVLTILLLLVTVVAVTGCDDETETPAPVEETVEQPKSTARLIEELKAKLQEIQNNIEKTESLLIKRIAQRDTAKSELNQFVYRTDKTPKEIKAELVKGKSELDSQIWFQEIRVAWNDLKDLERDVVIFTRQEERLNTTKLKLEQAIKKLIRKLENEGVYIPGEDPELDRLIAEGEVIDQDGEWDNLTSGEQAEIDIEVDKQMNETIENNVSKIPGLELKSIDELPALPDIAAMVTAPDSPAQKSLLGRVKNDCNKIMERFQKETSEYLKDKQPEVACSWWLEMINRIKEKVNSASDQFSEDTFTDYFYALETCQNDTLRIMSKPYLQTFTQCVKDLESKDPDWDAVAESLEGLLRIKPMFTKAEVETLHDQVDIVRSHLKYLLKENDRNAKVKSQRVETVLESVDFVYFEEYRKAGDRIVKVINGVEFAFRWCPPGDFTMGSPGGLFGFGAESGRDSDETQHEVTLTKGFWMMETEVTQKQWKAVMGDNPSYFKGDDLPVECVSWNNCQEFCKKCTQLGLPVQLPTEAQWEYACRAGTKAAHAGNLDEMAWYDDNSGSKTHPVGTKKPNAWGLYDMHGNVWEWCQDWKADYPSESVTDPTGPSSGSYRVYRGGCWHGGARDCRSAYRYSNDSGLRNYDLGFRVLREVNNPNKKIRMNVKTAARLGEPRV